MVDVFISYSRKNTAFVRRLFEALQAAGHETWADWEDIPYSVDWWKEICLGIDGANVLVFVISPDSLASMVCNQEVEYARQNNKRIIPVIHQDIDEKQAAGEWFNQDWETSARENWDYLKSLNWLFFRESNDFDAAFHSLMDTAAQDPEHIHYHTRLLVRAREWQTSTLHDPSLLLRGDDLRQAENWMAFNRSQTPEPTALHREYIQAAIALREQEELEAQKRRQRLRNLVVVLSILLVVAIIASGVAVNRSQVANSEAQARATQQRLAEDSAATAVLAQATAERSAQESHSLALAAQAQQALDSGDDDLALALALAAADMADPPSRAWDTLAAAAYGMGTVRILAHDDSPILDVAFSPDGQWAAAGNRAGQVIVWDSQTGQVVSVIRLDDLGLDSINSVHFSPDGHYLLVGTINQEARLWDMESGTWIRQFEGDGSSVRDAVFSADGRRILAGTRDGAVILWDTATGDIVERLPGHAENVNQVALSPDGRYAASVGDDGLLLLWNLDTGEAIWRFSNPASTIEEVAFSPDGRYLLANNTTNELRAWAVSGGAVFQTYTQAESVPVSGLAISPDGTLIAAGTYQGDVLVWDFTSGVLLERHHGHSANVSALAFSPDSQSLLSSSYDAQVRLWRVRSPLEADRFRGHTDTLTRLVLGPDGRTVFSASRDATIIQWDMQTGAILRTLTGHGAPIQALALGPNGESLWSGDESGRVIEWDVATGQEIRRYDEPDGVGVTSIDFRPGDDMALFSLQAFDGLVGSGYMLWDVQGWQAIQTYWEETPSRNAIYNVFSPDGQEIVTVGYDSSDILFSGTTGTIQRRDTISGEERYFQMAHQAAIWRIAYSPDARTYATVSLDRSVILWDAATDQIVRAFNGNTAEVVDAVFSPDGSHLVTAALDGRLILWQVDTGAPILVLDGNQGGTRTVIFADDGRELLSGGRDAILRLWQTPPTLPELIDWVAAHRYVRDLTCDERRIYGVTPLC